MWFRKKVLVNRGSSDFFTLVLRAWKKHCRSSSSICSVNSKKRPNVNNVSHQAPVPQHKPLEQRPRPQSSASSLILMASLAKASREEG